MIDLHDVSVITSATIDSADRYRNAVLFLRYFETFCVNYEIIIAEQDRDSKLKELTSDRAGVVLRFLESKNCHSRAKNLNSAAVLSERRFLLICDLDVFIPPESLEKALMMVRDGADFVLPFNGVGVQVKKAVIDQDMDLPALMSQLPYFSRLHELRPPKFDPEVFEHMYGSALADTVGGVMMCNRRQFFLSGAMNDNMISFACEEVEFFHRIKKLDYKVERIDDRNAFHFEHVRQTDSLKNNFFQANNTEWEHVKAMEAVELRRYANDGFKRIKLDTTCDLTITNTPSEYSIKLVQPNRIGLPNTCIVLFFVNSSKEDVRAVDKFFDHMEAHFDGYSIFVIEGEFARFRICLTKKNTQHISHLAPLANLTDEEIKNLIYTNRSAIEIYRFEDRFDPSTVTSRYNPEIFQAKEPL
jgi:hypothetical protein